MKKNWTLSDMPNLKGKVVIITGANSGLGLASAKALARKGAEVILACRSEERGAAALKEVEAVQTTSARLMLLDLGSLESVQAFAENFKANYDQLDVLMNNAGIMATPYGTTQDGFEKQIGVNHLGHFALTGHLLPVLLGTPGSRIVNVSSLAARNGQMDISSFKDPNNYQPWKAYGQSKLANLMFTLELNRRLPEGQTIAVAAHPGGASTNLGRNVKSNAVFQFIAEKVLLPLLPTPDQNARPQLYAAVGETVESDHYYGPGKWGEIAGPPKLVDLPLSIGQPADWSALWVASEELTGVSFLSQTV